MVIIVKILTAIVIAGSSIAVANDMPACFTKEQEKANDNNNNFQNHFLKKGSNISEPSYRKWVLEGFKKGRFFSHST